MKKKLPQKNSTNTSTSSSSKTTNNKNTNIPQNNKPKANNNTSNINTINIEPSPESQKEKIILDFKEILKPSLSENIDYSLYLELMNNLDRKDDLKTLAICRLILSQDPNNAKIKELHDLIYEDVKKNYYESGQLEKPKEEKMDKHMKLNKNGEYEHYFSDEEDEDED